MHHSYVLSNLRVLTFHFAFCSFAVLYEYIPHKSISVRHNLTNVTGTQFVSDVILTATEPNVKAPHSKENITLPLTLKYAENPAISCEVICLVFLLQETGLSGHHAVFLNIQFLNI